MGSRFRLPRAQPPTDHRTPGPVLGNTGTQAHPGNGFPSGGSQRRPHSSKDQQAVGKLPGACLTRGPAAGLRNKHGKVPQASGSENRPGAGLQQPLGQTAELVARHSSCGGGCTSSSAGCPGFLGVARPLPRPWSLSQKSEEARRVAPEERGPQTPGRGCLETLVGAGVKWAQGRLYRGPTQVQGSHCTAPGKTCGGGVGWAALPGKGGRTLHPPSCPSGPQLPSSTETHFCELEQGVPEPHPGCSPPRRLLGR